MLTNIDGSRIDVNKKYPHKGIVRGTSLKSQCDYMAEWRMYKCKQINYKMFVIESLDEDTETRRLSPIGLASQGYIDLINGPQDHGWCNGYTCQKRISTFQALVSTGQHYELHMSSYNPIKTRLMLLNANDGSDGITVEIYYPKARKLDIFRKSKYYETDNRHPRNYCL